MKTMITFEGNLGSDPELRFLPSGKPVARCRIASTERVKNGDEWVDGTTVWYEVDVWDNLGEAVAEQVRKGDKVLVQGTFTIDEWQGREGDKRTTPKVTAQRIGVIPRRTQVNGGTTNARPFANEPAPF